MTDLRPSAFFDLSSADIRHLFDDIDMVWQVIPGIQRLLANLLQGSRVIRGEVMPGAYIGDGPVFVGEGAVIEPGAYIAGPAYIGPDVTIRHGAYVRAHVIMMEGSLLGHASEAKNALLLPGAKAPHFAYVGDSVLGHRVNLGAGTKLSNAALTIPADPTSSGRKTINIELGREKIDTGLTKLGAILGDDVQTGCNAVLNPGTLLGPRVAVYANAVVNKGSYPADLIIKLRQDQVIAEQFND